MKKSFSYLFFVPVAYADLSDIVLDRAVFIFDVGEEGAHCLRQGIVHLGVCVPKRIGVGAHIFFEVCIGKLIVGNDVIFFNTCYRQQKH